MEVKLQERYKLFINGEWRDASDGQTVKTYSPVDGSLLAEVAEATDVYKRQVLVKGHLHSDQSNTIPPIQT